MSAPLQIGLVIFPKVTQLDFTGPLQVFSGVPAAKVHLIWKRIEPVATDSVMTLTPTVSFADCPQLDVICVPGGGGTDDMINDEEMLDFLRRQAEGAKYITSVCTGSLVLGAAGLLRGYRATTHWSAMENLAPFGATPTKTRVCVDRNRVTGGGVTAGIDFALTLVSLLIDRQAAEMIQLRLARYRAKGSARADEGADCGRTSAPHRGDQPRRGAARGPASLDGVNAASITGPNRRTTENAQAQFRICPLVHIHHSRFGMAQIFSGRYLASMITANPGDSGGSPWPGSSSSRISGFRNGLRRRRVIFVIPDWTTNSAN